MKQTSFVIDFRSPPPVLPSERDHEAEVRRAAVQLDWRALALVRFLPDDKIARDYPELADALDAAVRTDETTRRARRAPCPRASSCQERGLVAPRSRPLQPGLFDEIQRGGRRVG